MAGLTRYIGCMVLIRLAGVLLGVLALALTFDLLEAGDDVLERQDSLVALVRYGFLRLPAIGSDLLPVAALLAGILTAGDLLRRSELVAVWNIGFSPLQLGRSLIPAGLLMAGIQYILDDVARPPTTRELRAWQVGEFKTRGARGLDRGGIWLRNGDDIVRLVGDPTVVGGLSDLTIFRRDPKGLLIERLDAGSVRSHDGGWLLGDVIRHPVDARQSTGFPEVFWRGAPAIGGISLMARDPTELSLRQLWATLANDGFGVAPIDRQEAWLHARLAGLLVPFLMVLLPLGLVRFRRTGGSRPIVIFGLGIGFVFFVGKSALVALGQAGLLIPWAASWAPTIVLAGLVLGLTLVDDLQAGAFRGRHWRRMAAIAASGVGNELLPARLAGRSRAPAPGQCPMTASRPTVKVSPAASCGSPGPP